MAYLGVVGRRSQSKNTTFSVRGPYQMLWSKNFIATLDIVTADNMPRYQDQAIFGNAGHNRLLNSLCMHTGNYAEYMHK